MREENRFARESRNEMNSKKKTNETPNYDNDAAKRMKKQMAGISACVYNSKRFAV